MAIRVYLITTLRPPWMYSPFCVGWAESLRPCMSYHAPAEFVKFVVEIIPVCSELSPKFRTNWRAAFGLVGSPQVRPLSAL